MGKSTISMAIFHCYVSSPEGIPSGNLYSYRKWSMYGWFMIYRKCIWMLECTIPIDTCFFTSVSTFTLWWTNIAMENHHFFWENPLFLWPFSIAMLVHQRVYPLAIYIAIENGPCMDDLWFIENVSECLNVRSRLTPFFYLSINMYQGPSWHGRRQQPHRLPWAGCGSKKHRGLSKTMWNMWGISWDFMRFRGIEASIVGIWPTKIVIWRDFNQQKKGYHGHWTIKHGDFTGI